MLQFVRMDVSSRDLRNHTRAVLERVQRGEPVRITVNHRPVAEMVPASEGATWVPGRLMEQVLRTRLADRALLDDLQPLRGQFIESE